MAPTALALAPTLDDTTPVPSLTDRRAHPRVRVTWRVQVRYGAEEMVAHSTDVSPVGMFLETARPLPVSSQLHLSFSVEGGAGRETVEAAAVVVRSLSLSEARRHGTLPGVAVLLTRFLWGMEAFQAALARLQLDLPTPEQRRAGRLAVGIPVYWGHDPRVRRHAGYLSNLSTGGAFFIESAELAARGARLYLWFEVPIDGETHAVRAIARVARVAAGEGGLSARGMGVTLDVSPVDQRTLASFLDGRIAAVTRSESIERTHPTRIEELFLAAVNEWEEKGIVAAGATASEAGHRALGTRPAADGHTREAAVTGRCRSRHVAAAPTGITAPAAIDWRRVGSTAFAVSGFMAAALLFLFVGLLLQLV